MIKIIECPRDAMQGIADFIPTDLKIRYINQLLKVGYDTIDFGSFVSPKAVPQMADTKEVIQGLDLDENSSKLLAIVANLRGAVDAAEFPEITCLGYPFSISETFQQRNTRKSIIESVELVKQIQEICVSKGKELVVYISMAFGNPYNDPWGTDIAEKWVETLAREGINTFALADTVGSADSESIKYLFGELIPRFPAITFGAHFHAHPNKRKEKILAAWETGCRRFDTAMMGFGGCPFAEDHLVGNISTESLLEFCVENNIASNLNLKAFNQAQDIAAQIFG